MSGVNAESEDLVAEIEALGEWRAKDNLWRHLDRPGSST